jgi:mannose-6-phosphate isomerase-like protein (cupin superfamily)
MKCYECGEHALISDKFLNVFCTNECYFAYSKAVRPLLHYNLNELLVKEQFRNLFYTDENLQVATQTLKVGEKIGSDKDNASPEIHRDATQVFLLFQGTAKVTIFSEDKSDSLVIGDAREMDQIAIVPPKTFHLIENIGKGPLRLLTIYSPAVHTEEESK